MTVSERARNTPPSPTLAISAKAKALTAQGVDVINLAAGEPDFDTPPHIRQAAIDALNGGKTRYTATSGAPELKDAIAGKLARDNGLRYRPESIIVSCGAKQSLYNTMQALLDPGDEVVIPAPYWVTYPEQVKLAGGSCVFVQTAPEDAFMPTRDALRQAVTPRTRALLLNSPSNPTGGVASRQQIKDLAAVVVQRGLYLISDEIYEKLVYDGNEHVSPASLGAELFQRTVTINGCSKAYAMTGWRVGYAACADTDLISAMGRIQDQSTSNAASISQWAAIAALTGPQEPVEEMRRAFEERRDILVDGLNRISAIHCRMPGGAFYAFADVSALIGKRIGDRVIGGSDDLAGYLLDSARVAVIPGTGFGAGGFIRLSYAASTLSIREGLERIAVAVSKLE